MPELTIHQAFELAVQLHQAGRLQEAEQLYRQILTQDSAHADSLYRLGVIAQQVGRDGIAVDLILQAIALNPKYPHAHSGLGDVLHHLGRLDEAIDAYRQAIALQPKDAQSCNNLGNALRDKGQFDEAIAACLEAIALQPNFPESYNNLANALRDKGQIHEAIAAYRKAIALQPSYAQIHFNLGNALRDARLPDDAIAAYRQAIILNPSYADAYGNLGVVLHDQGQLDEAMVALRQAIALQPKASEVHYNLGNVLRDKGQPAEAIDSYRRAISLQPSLADAHYNLGLASRDLGQFIEAADCFRNALRLRLDARYFRGLISTGRQVSTFADVEQLMALLNRTGLSIDDRVAAEFALGKLLDDDERFDDAFAHYAAGNRLFKDSRAAASERFDGEALGRQVNGLIQNLTPEFYMDRRQWGDASESPVFIVGMPRSGTSLVEQIAASHPSVFGAGELQMIGQLSAAIPRAPEPTTEPGAIGISPGNWDAVSIAKASRSYLEHLRSLGGAAMRVTDKMPANVFHLGLIAVLFPNARVIFCRRDGRDNCLSCYFEKFIKNNLMFSYDLADCGRQYLETQRLAAHWLKTLPLRMIEMQYELLVTDQERQSRRLIDFLGLAWDPACLEFHRTKRPVLTASAWQVRQPMYNRSIGRWRHYASHLGPLLALLEGGR